MVNYMEYSKGFKAHYKNDGQRCSIKRKTFEVDENLEG
jgi:hypothetical protein